MVYGQFALANTLADALVPAYLLSSESKVNLALSRSTSTVQRVGMLTLNYELVGNRGIDREARLVSM